MKSGFPIFISVFLTIYGGLHYYIYKKAIKILPLAKWVTIAFLGFMVFAPLLIRILTNAGFTSLAVPLAWIGYTGTDSHRVASRDGLIPELINNGELLSGSILLSLAILNSVLTASSPSFPKFRVKSLT